MLCPNKTSALEGYLCNHIISIKSLCDVLKAHLLSAKTVICDYFMLVFPRLYEKIMKQIISLLTLPIAWGWENLFESFWGSFWNWNQIYGSRNHFDLKISEIFILPSHFETIFPVKESINKITLILQQSKRLPFQKLIKFTIFKHFSKYLKRSFKDEKLPMNYERTFNWTKKKEKISTKLNQENPKIIKKCIIF